MLDQLEAQSPDALLALIKMHAADPREDKIDLGVGVYRTNDGATPVFRAIKAAEQKLVDTQDSKSYLGPEGDTGFVDALKPYIFGKDATMGGRLEGMQTPGGTGAVRLAVALGKAAGITRIHLGTPSCEWGICHVSRPLRPHASQDWTMEALCQTPTSTGV